MQVNKHELYDNSQYFIPTFNIQKEFVTGPKTVAFLVSQIDFEAPQQQLQFLKDNQSLQKHLQQNGFTIGFGLNGIDKYILIYTKDHQDSSKGFKEGRKAQKIIIQEFKDNNQVSDLVLSNNFTQDFLNEFIYGQIIQNYSWQQKSYKDSDLSTNKKLNIPIKTFNLAHQTFDLNNQQFKELLIIARAKLYSKQLSNTRANVANTDYMFQEAKKLQENNKDTVDLQVLKGEEIKKAGLNLMYAVGQGAADPSYLVCLHYKGDKQNLDKTVSLVGKGVVFDSGGQSIKRAGMERMFGDKGGACSVLGIFQGIVELGLKVNVVLTLALVENCISSNSYRVSDIYQTLKGITVEIINTDAEGRNILVDAMTYTQQNYKPYALIDMATLTGACPMGLGQTVQGLFTNDYDKAQLMQKYSQIHQEEVWHLPLTDFMRDNIVSEQADIRNAGKVNYGGSGTAAAMLEKFIEEGVEWYHFDIAPSNQLGGEGQPIRTIINYVKDQFSSKN